MTVHKVFETRSVKVFRGTMLTVSLHCVAVMKYCQMLPFRPAGIFIVGTQRRWDPLKFHLGPHTLLPSANTAAGEEMLVTAGTGSRDGVSLVPF